jgi:serine/threonine protein kinase
MPAPDLITGTPRAFAEDPFEGTAYRSKGRIAAGGMGEVFLVEHRQLGREFVAKIPHQSVLADPRLVDRFRIEAQSLGRLRHPHIVSVVGFNTTSDGRPFMLLEHLHGRALSSELSARKVIPAREAVTYACQLLSALAAAHALGIVHRDIKPSNIFICDRDDGSRFLKVLDFGIARVLPGVSPDAPLPLALPTETGLVVGTPRFMSPEGALGRHVDQRADVYAAALVLYAMLAGRGPFDHAGSNSELLSAHANEEPKPPSRFAARPIPPELDRAILRALRKDADERFQSADGFCQALIEAAVGLAEPSEIWATTRALQADAAPPDALVSGEISISDLQSGTQEAPSPAKGGAVTPNTPRLNADAGPLAAGDQFLKYEIRGLLGRGGHASVYEGYDPFLDRCVAIKVMVNPADPGRDLRRRAQLEARVLCRLKHPNIVTVMDAGATDHFVYIIMEVLEGRTLRDVLLDVRTLTVAETLLLGACVADGVQAAHVDQVIHRDLKPENIFVQADNSVKVLDFGIAKFLGEGAMTTRQDLLHGTMPYMSPEHLQGKAVTPRSDIFALGAILYELLAGTPPCLIGLAERTMNAVALAQIRQIPPPLDKLNPAVPGHVASLIQRMIAKNPVERFASMQEVSDALRAGAARAKNETKNTVPVRELWKKSVVAAGDVPSVRSPHTSTTRHGSSFPLNTTPAMGAGPSIFDDGTKAVSRQIVPAIHSMVAGVSAARGTDVMLSSERRRSDRWLIGAVVGTSVGIGALGGLAIGLAHFPPQGAPVSPATVASALSMELIPARASADVPLVLPPSVAALPVPSVQTLGRPSLGTTKSSRSGEGSGAKPGAPQHDGGRAP